MKQWNLMMISMDYERSTKVINCSKSKNDKLHENECLIRINWTCWKSKGHEYVCETKIDIIYTLYKWKQWCEQNMIMKCTHTYNCINRMCLKKHIMAWIKYVMNKNLYNAATIVKWVLWWNYKFIKDWRKGIELE